MKNKIATHLFGISGLVSIAMSAYCIYIGDKDQATWNLVLGWMLLTGAANYNQSLK